MTPKRSSYNRKKISLWFNTSSDSVINLAGWEENLSGDRAAVYKMLKLLLTELIKVKAELSEAYDHHNRKSLKKIIEKLHNNLLFCGLPQLKALVENFCRVLRSPSSSDELIIVFYGFLLKEMSKVNRLGSDLLKKHYQSQKNT